ncbi:MAG TPA: SRPBCC domain-containing protein [Gammaproteobacteria bacterium]
MAQRNNAVPAQALELTLTRVYNAPCSLVFACWTENRHLKEWSAPHGFTMPHAEGKAEPGGSYRVCMKKPDGSEIWLHGIYKEVVPNRKLVMTHIWEQEDGKPGEETLVTALFEDLSGKTRVTLIQTGFESMASRDGHGEGWSECFERLESLLSKLSNMGIKS